MGSKKHPPLAIGDAIRDIRECRDKFAAALPLLEQQLDLIRRTVVADLIDNPAACEALLEMARAHSGGYLDLIKANLLRAEDDLTRALQLLGRN